MIIQGLQKISLLDYPEKVSCTVFLSGCNFKCPFCHNASLVISEKIGSQNKITDLEFFEFLKTRIRKLDGVCITGGEPLLRSDLEGFIKSIKDLGFLVKLDTNGYNPKALKDIVNTGMIDFVAMDIKNSQEHYSLSVGVPDLDIKKICESVSFLLSETVPFEFRTTVVEELHTEEDLIRIGEWIQGTEDYYLQQFVDSGDVITNGLHSPTIEKMERYKDIIESYVPNVKLRGI